MAYEKQTWANGVAGGTPIDADALNHIEAGIEAAVFAADAAKAVAETASEDLAGATRYNGPGTLIRRDPGGGGWIYVNGVVMEGSASEVTEPGDLTPKAYVDGQVATKVSADGVEGIKTHDGTATGGTRPTGYARVRWVGGTTRPTNMVAGDVWEHDA